MGAYDKISFRGHEFDKITAAGVRHAETFLKGSPELHVAQGPYSTATAASYNTHAGSGAVDISQCRDFKAVQWAFRLAGWAAWHRTEDQGDWVEHVHAIQLGNKRIASTAGSQVTDYMHRRNGLKGHAYDGTKRPEVIVPFNFPLPTLDLELLIQQARAKKPTPHGQVKVFQRTLILKTGVHNIVVDGIYGPQTKDAFRRWERANGGDGDGIPGSLTKRFGAARFQVKNAG